MDTPATKKQKNILKSSMEIFNQQPTSSNMYFSSNIFRNLNFLVYSYDKRDKFEDDTLIIICPDGNCEYVALPLLEFRCKIWYQNFIQNNKTKTYDNQKFEFPLKSNENIEPLKINEYPKGINIGSFLHLLSYADKYAGFAFTTKYDFQIVSMFVKILYGEPVKIEPKFSSIYVLFSLLEEFGTSNKDDIMLLLLKHCIRLNIKNENEGTSKFMLLTSNY
jgi:hypothetical protein